ncbi:glyoxalase/bleomycin resistance protein/dioxygenase [Deinococcus aerius]|uniref:Glyoxalase/bleomycin resistance protein/dioxygenase n=1 Tax=Deinococcus aerius TaxID=200253 RepID=A0A2I9E1D6_9DEIO|nr:VOC family protein [Deinococcus aerius]GBF07445.1 glyoxalase/bleomycin resistance protein/dioxygenase [Deinococcus aerius]
MQITQSALSLNVPDVRASAEFLQRHFGFVPEMEYEGVASLTRGDAGFNLIFLQTGLSTFKPRHIAGSAGQGLLVVFVVDDIDAEYARLQAEGVPIVTPIETEPWGERYFQVSDPNGLILQLVQWVEVPQGSPWAGQGADG